MFSNILAPVDLAHVQDLRKALNCAGDLARHYGAEVTYVGVTASAPSDVAHNEREYAEALAAFAAAEGARHGVTVHSRPMHSNDPVTDVDDALLRAVQETGADLVVMQSHAPSILDYLWPSNGGKLAEHAPCSVMVVRV